MPGRTKGKMGEPETAAEDQVMDDAPVSEAQESGDDSPMDQESESVLDDGEHRIKILPGSTDTAASFEFIKEGHTLGNALRYVIMKNPDVEFCAYAIPHPSEEKMNLRIQTYERPATEALSKGIKDLKELCDFVMDDFWEKRNEFEAKKAAEAS